MAALGGAISDRYAASYESMRRGEPVRVALQ